MAVWMWVTLWLGAARGREEPAHALYPGGDAAPDFVIGALFAIHEQPRTQQEKCGAVWEQYGVQRTELTFMTLDKINADPDLLPNVTLGAVIRDSCWNAPVSLQQTIELVREYLTIDDESKQTCSSDTSKQTAVRARKSKSHLIGVLGPGPSSVSMQVQNILQVFSVPQMGYSATSSGLSNKEKFSTFFRVVPSDEYQARALIELVRYHNWTYVYAINTDENYGQSGMKSFRDQLKNYPICIAGEYQIMSTASEKQFDEVIEKIRPKHSHQESTVRVVVCFCEGKTVKGLLAAIKKKKLAGQLLLIGSDGWANRGDVAQGSEEEAHGSLTIRIHSQPDPDFDKYYLALNPSNNKRNPWFKEMWEHKYNCSMESVAHRRRCREQSDPKKYTQDPKSSFVVRGIYAFAHALHKMQQELCGNQPGVCPQLEQFDIKQYEEYLKNVSFKTNTVPQETVSFNKRNDPSESNIQYDIMNYQRIKDGEWRYKEVGHWRGRELELTGQIWYSGAGGITTDPAQVHSFCSKPCPDGSVKSPVENGENRCCWKCKVCEGQSIKHNETSCIKCGKGEYANGNKTVCIKSKEEFIKFSDTEAIVGVFFSCLGLAMTAFTAVVFIKYNNTPVVKSSTRELSYLILFGIIISHTSVFSILAQPTVLTCALNRILPGISFAMIYASVFTKTHRISRILAGSKKRFPTRKMRFMSGTAQVVISLGLTLSAVCVCGYSLWEHPPRAVAEYSDDGVRLKLVCASPPRGVLLPLAPALALLSACAVLAVRTRALPHNFNEAKFIGVATYTTCVIWIAFFPTYFGSDSKSITLCMCVTLSATVMLLFLFYPRLYIVLFHPEQNNRAYFITTRSIRCHIGGARTKYRERDEILSMEHNKRSELRTISCQTSLESIPQYGVPAETASPPASPPHYTDWTELDAKAYLEQYKCHNQNHFNTNKDNTSPSTNNIILRNPISLSVDVQPHARIREDTVSQCSLTDEDGMTQIKDITITLGLMSGVKNRKCCRDREDEISVHSKKGE